MIFLSSIDDEIDRIVGLELGVDDYLTKPFSPRELVARIRAVLRRTEASPGQAAEPAPGRQPSHGGLRLNLDCFLAFWQEREVTLTAIQCWIMKALLSNLGKVFNLDELMDRMVDSPVRRVSRFTGSDWADTYKRETYILYAGFSKGMKWTLLFSMTGRSPWKKHSLWPFTRSAAVIWMKRSPFTSLYYTTFRNIRVACTLWV